ncbi:hypothetical protein J2X76_006284 [Neorhizobium sp. 2083]|uniref:hypothetical protein n=1 Tax=Neorhizobium sp. 2083 TaxID=2817762 RepID=UPI00285BA0F2|nr:hypothetical protein [Neorhizobium sp. 2083]MDR6821084.1 hypothetical protein [Neorhizobium sp. 2083]
MREKLQELIAGYEHRRQNEARQLYVDARNAATELRVVDGVGSSLAEADEIDVLADALRDVFELHEKAKISLVE